MVSTVQTRMTDGELKRQYGQEYVERFEAAEPIKRLERLVPLMDIEAGAIIADFACGNALMLELLDGIACEYRGVDFSEDFIRAANRRIDKLNAKNASLFCEPISKFCDRFQGQFDVAMAMDFSEHVYDDTWTEILSDIRLSLKPGGKLYLHTPNANFFIEMMKKKNFLLKQFPDHIAVRNAEENRKLLEIAGFSSVKIHYLPHYLKKLSWIHMMSSLPIFGKYFRARLFIECAR